MATWTYSRVSTTIQAEDGESLGVQERMTAGYCLMHGMEITGTFVERGVSGSVPLHDRPEGARLLDGLSKGDVIVCAKLDRMFRDARDALNVLHTLKSKGVSLHFIDLGGDVVHNGLAKLMFTVLSAFAEMERDRIKERISDVKKDQSQRGRFLGGQRPFGFDVAEGGALIENAAEQAAIARMKALKAEGKSLRTISAIMAEEGTTISHNAVKKLVA